MSWHYEDMAVFCSFFPWCSPDVFWHLTLPEYSALVDEMRRAVEDG